MKYVFDEASFLFKVRCLLYLHVLLALNVAGAIETSFRVNAVRIDNNIELTGTLSSPEWKRAEPIAMKYELQPGNNIPAEQQTTAYVLYSYEYLYFGFDCRDTNISAIRANVCDRDKISQDDFIALYLDTYGDNQHAYGFAVNPFGIQADLMKTSSNDDASFDAVWSSKGVVHDSGWTVEVAIPFKSLRFPSDERQEWGLSIQRNYPRESRKIFSWSTYDRNNPCFLCQGGKLANLRNIQTSSTVELLPYILGGQSGAVKDRNDASSQFIQGKMVVHVGGGIKYSPDPDVAIEAVVNPDFSQVEADAIQITVNNPFALYYTEKRPFFLNGKDLFETRRAIFYSRSINNPLGAVKYQQKFGKLSLGYIGAYDREVSITVPGSVSSFSVQTTDNAFVNILRQRYDFGDQSFIGSIATSRHVSSTFNYVGGVDWNIRFEDNYSFGGQFVYSRTKEIQDSTVSSSRKFGATPYDVGFNGEVYSGTLFVGELTRATRMLTTKLYYQDFSPTFQAQNGFENKNDFRQVGGNATYSFYPEQSFVDNGAIYSEVVQRWYYDGNFRSRYVFISLDFRLKGQTRVGIGLLPINDELYNGELFTAMRRISFLIDANPFSWVSFSVSSLVGLSLYRSAHPTIGSGSSHSFDVTFKPSNQFSIHGSYEMSTLSEYVSDSLFFKERIVNVGLSYQFSPELFIRGVLQFSSSSGVINIDPLISYKLNPFTIFYLGSSHSATQFDNPFVVKHTSQQLFAKLQYLWR